MGIGSKAGCLIWAAAAWAAAAEFPVRHKHLTGGCAGVLTVDQSGVSFAGPKKHVWRWKMEEIRELKLAPDGIYVLSYHGGYDFAGKLPVGDLYRMLEGALDRRLVMEDSGPADAALKSSIWSAPVNHRGGTGGRLAFGGDAVVFTSAGRDESRTWRYQDIDRISSSGPFQLTVTTFERALAHYHERRDFNFELKQAITEATYNQLWLLVEHKNGRIP